MPSECKLVNATPPVSRSEFDLEGQHHPFRDRRIARQRPVRTCSSCARASWCRAATSIARLRHRLLTAPEHWAPGSTWSSKAMPAPTMLRRRSSRRDRVARARKSHLTDVSLRAMRTAGDERAVGQQRDLERAANYVQSLLAQPIDEGPLRTEWMFRPSARLGGDAFGCDRLDGQTFAVYLFDVCGHGIGAAMHSVSVLNVLRQRAVPGADLRNPREVLTSLNAMFQMDSHDGQYFTMWYGVYDTDARLLRTPRPVIIQPTWSRRGRATPCHSRPQD